MGVVSTENFPPFQRHIKIVKVDVDGRPHTNTHTIESKETKQRTLKCKKPLQMLKISHQKSIIKSKNHCSPVKLDSKKQDKK